MSSKSTGLLGVALCALVVSSCGGGGGGAAPPPPPPPPPSGDTTPPETTVGGAPAAPTNSRTATLTIASSETGSTFEASLDGAAYVVVTTPYTINNLADGDHSVSLRARDAANNVDASPATATWTVDGTAPETTVSGAPAATTNARTATFAISSNETGATFEASLDGAAFVAVTTPYTINNLADGSHSVSLRARDAASNVDASPATATWVIDGTPPVVQIVFPGSAAVTDAASIRLRGTAQDAATLVSLKVNGVAAASADGFRNWTATVNVGTGTNTYSIVAVDSAGNANSPTIVTVTNRGVVASLLRWLALDEANNRVLATDWQLGAILAFRTTDGVARIFSDPAHGTGTHLSFPNGLVIDSPRNRVLTYDSSLQKVLAIDLTTGDRSELGPPNTDSALTAYGDLAYRPASNHAYVANGYPGGVVDIDLTGNTRSSLTNNSLGSGPSFVQSYGVVLDTSVSGGGGTRLLVSDVGSIPGRDQSRLIAVDLATGNRTLLSSSASPAVGAGPAMFGIGKMHVDAANNRVLVMEYRQTGSARLFAIDLGSGARTMLQDTGVSGAIGSLAVDGGATRAYLLPGDRARLLRLDLGPQQQVTPFADSLAGSGTVAVAYNSLELDTSGPSPSLIAGAQTNAFGGSAAVLRIDVGTGARSLISGSGVGSGPALLIATSVQFDRRSGGGPGQLLALDPGYLPTQLLAIDMATGNRTKLSDSAMSFDASNITQLDPDRDLMLSGQIDTPSSTYALVGTGIVGGAVNTLSLANSLGTGPAFGFISAIGIENAAGSPRRYIVATRYNSAIFAVDPANGNRVVVSDNSSVGTGPPLVDVIDMDIDSTHRRALVLGNVSNFSSLQFVDLVNGSRSHVSGPRSDDLVLQGSGPQIVGYGAQLRADFARGLAYVVTNTDSILAIDLATGDRAIVSR